MQSQSFGSLSSVPSPSPFDECAPSTSRQEFEEWAAACTDPSPSPLEELRTPTATAFNSDVAPEGSNYQPAGASYDSSQSGHIVWNNGGPSYPGGTFPQYSYSTFEVQPQVETNEFLNNDLSSYSGASQSELSYSFAVQPPKAETNGFSSHAYSGASQSELSYAHFEAQPEFLTGSWDNEPSTYIVGGSQSQQSSFENPSSARVENHVPSDNEVSASMSEYWSEELWGSSSQSATSFQWDRVQVI